MKARTTILLEESLLRKLKKEAFENNTSVTNIIENLVKEHFEKNVKVEKLLWIKNSIEENAAEELKRIVITPSLEIANSLNSLTISLLDVKETIGSHEIDDLKQILVFTCLAFVKKIIRLINSDLLYVEEENLNPFSIAINIKNTALTEQEKKLLTNSILNLSDSFPNVSYFEEGESFRIVVKNS
jgi:hypothetical protein